MASDRGQNRKSDFVASKSLLVVGFLSSWHDLNLFVSSSFSIRRNLFFVASSFVCFVGLFPRQVSRFVVMFSSWRRRLFVSSVCFLRGVIRLFASSCSSFRRRRYKQVCGNKSLPAKICSRVSSHVMKTRWREK